MEDSKITQIESRRLSKVVDNVNFNKESILSSLRKIIEDIESGKVNANKGLVILLNDDTENPTPELDPEIFIMGFTALEAVGICNLAEDDLKALSRGYIDTE